MMHVKVLNDMSNKCFDMILQIIKRAFSMCGTNIPGLFYEAKRKLRELGLGYMPVSMIIYCSGRSSEICKSVKLVVSLSTWLVPTTNHQGKKFHIKYFAICCWCQHYSACLYCKKARWTWDDIMINEWKQRMCWDDIQLMQRDESTLILNFMIFL